MNQASNSEPVGEQIPSEKLACDLEFFSKANVFAETAIANIPELQAVAIVPLWAPALNDVPTGILRLRNEQPPYLGGLLQMLARIAAFGIDVHKDMFKQMQSFDRMAANLVAEIKAKTTDLHDINTKQANNAAKSPE